MNGPPSVRHRFTLFLTAICYMSSFATYNPTNVALLVVLQYHMWHRVLQPAMQQSASLQVWRNLTILYFSQYHLHAGHDELCAACQSQLAKRTCIACCHKRQPTFATCKATKGCVAICKKSRAILYFSQCHSQLAKRCIACCQKCYKFMSQFLHPAMQQKAALQVARKVELFSTFLNVTIQVDALNRSMAPCNEIFFWMSHPKRILRSREISRRQFLAGALQVEDNATMQVTKRIASCIVF